ncbi:MAG: hypothetical protein ACREO0_01950 [Pseudoxanthomonas sp.]
MTVVTTRERTRPTQDELEDVLAMLIAANDAGELVHLSFMLQRADSGDAMVDFRGDYERAEITTRTVRTRIAQALDATEPELAQRIRDTTGPAPNLILVKH